MSLVSAKGGSGPEILMGAKNGALYANIIPEVGTFVP